MKTLKSSLIVAFLILSSMVFAQPGGGGQKGGKQGPPPIPNAKQIEKMVSDIAVECSLSAEEEVKVLDIYNNHFEIIKDKTSRKEKPRKEEMQALQSVLEKNVKALLTDEQIEKYESYNKKHKHERPKD